MADTLEITYFLNNTELEFSQLSGAQKLLVSLALRLGLAAVISKRLFIYEACICIKKPYGSDTRIFLQPLALILVRFLVR
jgi:hypothetical protein